LVVKRSDSFVNCFCCCLCSALPNDECRDNDFERFTFPIVILRIVVADERILELLSESSVVLFVNFSLSKNCLDGL